VSASSSLLVRQARTPDDDRLVDVLVEAGRVTAVGPRLEAPPGVEVLEANGQVLLPGLVDSHLHLDKTLMGEPWIPLPEAIDLRGRMAASDRVLAHATRRSTEERAAALVRSALAFGTTALRSHVDVKPSAGLAPLEALLRTREQFAGLMDMQLVAFPQDGVLRSPGTEALLDEALALGADVLGGIDPGGMDGDLDGQLRCLFRLARRHEVGLDIHLHDPGSLGAFEMARIVEWTLAEGFQGRVAISHAFALGEVDDREAAALIERLARAEITIVTNGPGHRPSPRVPALWAAGVRVAIGNDNVHDAWWPWGRGDLLERTFLVSYRSGLRTDAELRLALRSATLAGAELLGLGPYGVIPGATADFVLVAASCAPEAVAAHPARAAVLKRGRVLARDGQLLASVPGTSGGRRR
jgi:cytosine deaminase